MINKNIILGNSSNSLQKWFIVHILVMGKQTQRHKVLAFRWQCLHGKRRYLNWKKYFYYHTACWLLWGQTVVLVSFTSKAAIEVIFYNVFAESFQYGQNPYSHEPLENLQGHSFTFYSMHSFHYSFPGKGIQSDLLRFLDLDRKLYFLLCFERQKTQKLKQMCQDLSTLVTKQESRADHYHLCPKGIYGISTNF